MSYLPQYKLIDKCSQCGDTNCKGRKRQKDYYCLSCIRGNDTRTQISKAKIRDAEREAQIKKLPPKEKRSLRSGIASKIRNLIDSDVNKEGLSKSKLLKLCDAAFSRYIRNRDTHGGKVTCICCKKVFDADAVDKDGQRIIQCLHFVKRSVYSLRFDEYQNCNAGCCYCNKDMNDAPFGIAYQCYRQTLVERIGEPELAAMELEHRKINRLEESQLKVILEHYSTSPSSLI